MNLKHSSLCGLVEFHKMNLAAIIKPNNNKIKTKFRFFFRELCFYVQKRSNNKKGEILGREFPFIFKIYRSSTKYMFSEYKFYILH